VVSGGSTDSTNNILSEYKQNPNVKLIFEKTQISKIEAVNLAVKKAKHELLVFSDCRQKMQKGSVRQLIHNFNNPDIGTVTATLVNGEKKNKLSFRNLLNFIAHCESKSGSCLNVFGALYAQRKSIFREFPNDLLFDDLFVVVSTMIQNKRLLMDKKALIYDVPFRDYYMPDRIHRLTRGLLIFLTNQYKMILRLPVFSLFRFIVFKYFKLILPFVFVLTSAVFTILYYKSIPMNVILLILCALLIPFMIKKTRQLMVHFIKINCHFIIATVQFFFFGKKSNRWEKLKIPIKETDFTKNN
jgi:cellulose synthase/poly-beta-1,6-N-acetylglucosamine synthase-like glycosyltransferase